MKVSPRKIGLVADMVRGKDVQRAIDTLKFSDKKWSNNFIKLINSAVNNASGQRGINVDALYVKTVEVGKSVTLKRFMTRARGSASQILKRCSCVTVVLEERTK
ncbi:50S ribosomal protein L22 [bacterium]|nr:50S ribosomal protein L22 [bacterium]MBU1919124.1 50S ribosomal protein L22 [bacterium]